MNYGSSEVATVALTIRFDNAAQTTGLGGVGTNPYTGTRSSNGSTSGVGTAE